MDVRLDTLFYAEKPVEQTVWEEKLVTAFNDLFYSRMNVSPADQVIHVNYPLLCPDAFVRAAIRTLLSVFNARSVSVLPSAFSALFCTAKLSGLVVSIGSRETHIVAVLHGFAVPKSIRCLPVGTDDVLRRLLRALRCSSDVGDLSSVERRRLLRLVTSSSEQDLQAKTGCASAEGASAEGASAAAAESEGEQKPRRDGDCVEVTVAGVKYSAITASLELCMEDLLTGLEDRTGIAEGLLRSLADCPCDGRLDVASAVLVCGEGGEIPAIHAAIRGGIEDCFSGDNGSRFASVRKAAESLRFCHSQYDATVLSWRGASIVASMPFLQRELITQRKLDEGFTWKDPIVGL